jgi:hypothetical protein
MADDVHGTIRLHDSAIFTVTTSRMDVNYEISTSNTNDFTLVPQSTGGEETILAIASDGTTVNLPDDDTLAGPGEAFPDKKQIIHLELSKIQDIEWTSVGVQKPGYTIFTYKGTFSPQVLKFDPPIVFSLKKGVKTVGTTGLVPIRELDYSGNTQVRLQSGAISLQAQRVKLALPGGFQENDDFLVAAGEMPLKAPALGSGKEIVFVANEEGNSGVPINLYHPSAGPHVLAFFKNIEKSIGFDCNDITIDASHLLNTSARGATQLFRIPTQWYHPFVNSFEPTSVVLNISFDDPSIYLYSISERPDVKFFTARENRLSVLADSDALKEKLDTLTSASMKRLYFPLHNYLEERAWSLLTLDDFTAQVAQSNDTNALLKVLGDKRRAVSSISLPIVWSGKPLRIYGQIAPPERTPVGIYDCQVVLKGANLETSHVPIRIELYDPLGSAKQTFAGVSLALFTTYCGWLLFDRRRKNAEGLRRLKEIRTEFIRDHYLDIVELKQRLKSKWNKHDVEWNDLSTDLLWMLQKQLQGIFDANTWTLFEKYFVAEDIPNMKELLRAELRDI